MIDLLKPQLDVPQRRASIFVLLWSGPELTSLSGWTSQDMTNKANMNMFPVFSPSIMLTSTWKCPPQGLGWIGKVYHLGTFWVT